MMNRLIFKSLFGLLVIFLISVEADPEKGPPPTDVPDAPIFSETYSNSNFSVDQDEYEHIRRIVFQHAINRSDPTLTIVGSGLGTLVDDYTFEIMEELGLIHSVENKRKVANNLKYPSRMKRQTIVPDTTNDVNPTITQDEGDKPKEYEGYEEYAILDPLYIVKLLDDWESATMGSNRCIIYYELFPRAQRIATMLLAEALDNQYDIVYFSCYMENITKNLQVITNAKSQNYVITYAGIYRSTPDSAKIWMDAAQKNNFYIPLQPFIFSHSVFASNFMIYSSVVDSVVLYRSLPELSLIVDQNTVVNWFDFYLFNSQIKESIREVLRSIPDYASDFYELGGECAPPKPKNNFSQMCQETATGNGLMTNNEGRVMTSILTIGSCLLLLVM